MKQQVYFDHNATSPLHPEVVFEYCQNSTKPYNASSLHSYGRQAKQLLEQARTTIGESLNIEDVSNYHIIFTSSGTEANNLFINSFDYANIIISAIEHISISKPASLNKNCQIITVDDQGLINLTVLEQLLKITKNPVVSIIMANNETGVIQDMAKIIELVKQYNGIIHSDAVQCLGKIKLDLSDLALDAVTISAHKCGGPVGAACLIIKKNLNIKPMMLGGSQETNFRAGTENIIAITSFALATKLANKRLTENMRLAALRDKLEQRLSELCPELIIASKQADRLPNTSCIMLPVTSSETLLINLDLAGFAVSAGSACSSGRITASHVLKAMNYNDAEASSAIRISLGYDNTEYEINQFVKSWAEIYNRIKNNER